MEVIKKEQWDTWKLKDGDKVEFLEFVGGGWFYNYLSKIITNKIS
jgi:hypothetical protein